MRFSRREMLGLGVGAAAVLATGSASAAVLPRRRVMTVAETAKPKEEAKKKVPVGLQLYSIRDLCQKDLPGTLAAVAKIGYAGVEFAGYYNRKAEEIRKLLDDNKLKALGTHTGMDTLTGNNFKATVEFNKTIGNTFLIVPMLTLKSKDQIISTAKQFTDVAAKAKEVGMVVGYHSHDGDFKKLDGETLWDILFTNCGPDVVAQLDIGHCINGGGDPVAAIKKFPGRSKSIHVTEHGGKRGATIGEGTVKWDEIFPLLESVGGVERYIIEQETYDVPPMDSVARCFEGMKKLGKV
jgi:sugar phosphate isomerase/epimerase